jgi:RHS repeat-associated protein
MARWWVSEPYINVHLEDSPLAWTPERGPSVSFDLSYRQRGSVEDLDNQSTTVFGVGPNWSCSFRAFLLDTGDGTTFALHRGGAGVLLYTVGAPGYDDGGVLSTPDGGATYQILFRDGAVWTFGKAFGSGQWFLTSQADPAGNTLTFTYSTDPSVVQLTAVTDADGHSAQILYENTSFPLQITKVIDPYNRTAVLQYDSTPGSGVLTNISDVMQLPSRLAYDTSGSNWITSMATPYGTTTFTYGGVDAHHASFYTTGNVVNRFVTVTLPDTGSHLFLYRQDCSAFLSASNWQVPTNNLPNTLETVDQQNRDSFHWSPLQYAHLTHDPTALTAAEYNIGRLRHWLTNSSGVVTESLSLERAPSPDGTATGQVTWFDYDGKISGANSQGTNALESLRALVLPEGSSRSEHLSRNTRGSVKQGIATYTAPNGTATFRTNTFAYAANDIDLLQQIGPNSEQVVSNYFSPGNTFHRPDASYDALNQPTAYYYNANRQLAGMVSASGLTTTNFYLTSGASINFLATNIEIEISRTNSYTCNNGLVYSHTDERGVITTNYFDALQRLTGMGFPDGTTTSNLYTALDLTAAKDRLGNWTRFLYNSIRQKIAETNANGIVTGWTYCNCGALLSMTNAWNIPGVQQVTTFAYDLQGNRTNVLYDDGYTVTNWFNALGQIVTNGDGQGYSYFFYNNQGLLTTTSNDFGVAQKTLFDNEDRALQTKDSSGVLVTNSFDKLGRVLIRGYPDGGQELFGYSARGLIAYTNQIGASNFFALDPGGRKIFETNANHQILQFAYDQSGNLTNLVDGENQTTRWVFDTYNRLTNKFDQAGDLILIYNYDADNRIVSRWSSAKGTTFYTNDPMGNLIYIKYPTSHFVQMQYDPLNRLTNMVDNSGTSEFTWTKGNQLLTEQQPFVGDTVTNTFTNRLRIALALGQPSGTWTNGFSYDSARRLSTVISPAGTFSYGYTNVGPGTIAGRLLRKLTLANGAYVTNTYDSVARVLTNTLSDSANGVLDQYAYMYNLANQRTNLTRWGGSYYALAYDKIGQLTIATNPLAPAESRGYLYDDAWNLNDRTNNGAVAAFTVDLKNQLKTEAGIACTYDANGNLTEAGDPTVTGGYVYTYDDENRLTEIYTNYNITQGPLIIGGTTAWRTDFVYDGLGRLRKRLEYINEALNSTTEYIYDGNRVIQERNGNDVPTAGYTRGNDLSGTIEGAGGIGGLLARSDQFNSGNFTEHDYYFADANGNITYLTDASQTTVAQYRYDPFGNTISSSGSMSALNNYRFSSKEVHANSGMYYYGFRFYDPNLQRWISRDPLGELGFLHSVPSLDQARVQPRHGATGAVNAYRFLRNAPVVRVDPLGLQEFTCKDLADAAADAWADHDVASYYYINEIMDALGCFDPPPPPPPIPVSPITDFPILPPNPFRNNCSINSPAWTPPGWNPNPGLMGTVLGVGLAVGVGVAAGVILVPK